MFLITPKTKGSSSKTEDSRPIAKVSKPARVHTACDRCRIKKVKCDGDMPCLRCQQDEVGCIVTKKAPADAQAASREYIHAIETQQTRLIHALKRMHRHIRQPVEEDDMKEIIETVRACGFEFEGISDLEKPQDKGGYAGVKPNDISATTQSSAVNTNFSDGRQELEESSNAVLATTINRANSSPKKRKRTDPEQSISHEILPGPTIDQRQRSVTELADQEVDTQRPISKRPSLKRGMPTDDYWNLDNYLDLVAAPYTQNQPIPEGTTLTLNQTTGPAGQFISNDMSNWQPSMSSWMPDTSIDPQFFTQNGSTMVEEPSTIDLTAPIPSSFQMPTTWDSTLWWDPSSLIDLNAEDQGLDPSVFALQQ